MARRVYNRFLHCPSCNKETRFETYDGKNVKWVCLECGYTMSKKDAYEINGDDCRSAVEPRSFSILKKHCELIDELAEKMVIPSKSFIVRAALDLYFSTVIIVSDEQKSRKKLLSMDKKGYTAAEKLIRRQINEARMVSS